MFVVFLMKTFNLEVCCCLAGAVMGFTASKESQELDWTCDNAMVQINVYILVNCVLCSCAEHLVAL